MASVLTNTLSWVRRHRRRVAEIGIGHASYATFSWFFDNVLYVYVLYRLGLVLGGAIMTFMSLSLCAATLVLYERMRIDWVGAGSLARVSSLSNPSWWQRTVLWASRRGFVVSLVLLSVLQDPFITTTYFRRGRFDGLQARDWQTFFASGVIANLYWTLRSGAVVVLIRAAWRWLTHA